MDALFDTINLSDLLSGHDLTDTTTPLSAPDLRLLINRLDSHSLRIKSKVQTYLLSHHADFSTLFSLCNDTVSKTGEISEEISDVVRLIDDRPIDIEIRRLVEEISRKTKEVRVKRELLHLVGSIVGICEGLESAREGLRTGQLVFAAKRVRELKVALRVGDEEEGEPIVYGLLRKEWSDCFEEIQEMLSKLMEKAIHFEQEPNRVRIKYGLGIDGTDGIELRTVLEAMDVVGVLDYGFAKVADLMIKHVITPAVRSVSVFTLVEDINSTSGEAILKLVSSDSKSQNEDGDAIYSGIIQAVKFLYNFLCFENVSWIKCFGRLTWPRISELIISSFLSKAVPKDAAKLVDFQKVSDRTSAFETALKEMKFIASDDKDERLSKFTENVQVHFASRKKIEILATARNLLLKCDFTVPREFTMKGSILKTDDKALNSSEHVVDLLFSSKRCVVSKATSQLMELVHKTLQDVCLSSDRVAMDFYHAARDSILLYEAIVPVKLKRQLDGINQAAVLMHNDCLYLSQEILGLAFEYRADFPTSIKEYAVFADMAPRFQIMAEEILQRQIQLVISNLAKAIDGSDGFQNTHEIQQYESAKFSIEQVIFMLEKVHIIWEPLLLPSSYKKSMCIVLESVFSQIAKDILLLDDMAAEETFQLQKLIHLLLENLSSLFESIVLAEETSLPLGDLIPSLNKIRKMAELLDMPLKSITLAWETGELFSCGFTRTEVQGMIKAIFTDSPLRKECLWKIERASF